jgi:hypothetical protein
MKRSEFIKRVCVELWKIDDFAESEFNIKDYESKFDKVLTIIETMGMKPPYSDKVFQRNARKYIEPSGNEWDDENESN